MIIKRKSAVSFSILILCLFLQFAVSGVSAEELLKVKGKVKGFAHPAQSKTLSLSIPGKGVTIFKYNNDTVFKNFKSLQELEESAAIIEYKAVGSDYIAASIKKAFVSLPKDVKEITTGEMASLIKDETKAGTYFLVDARPSKRYAEGHIPNAVSLPTSVLVKGNAELLPDNKDIHLIFYCGGPTCGLSPKAAGIAKKSGYTNVKVYVQGEPGWRNAGYLTTSTTDYIKDANIVLIDLRSEEAIRKGYIPGAVSVPIDKLPSYENKFPSYKAAHIVFYSDDREDISKAISTVSRWGFKKTSAYLGGVESWISDGNELTGKAAVTQIAYTRKLAPGEISINNFEEALESDAVILDVRTRQEYQQGHFKNAINIPVDELASRYEELSKDRTIVTHCKTGVRAEMAHTILKGKGYTTTFLQARPVFNPDGSYKIVEW